MMTLVFSTVGSHTAKTQVTSSAPAADFLFSTALTSIGIKSSSCVALLDDVSSCSNVKSLIGSSASREGGGAMQLVHQVPRGQGVGCYESTSQMAEGRSEQCPLAVRSVATNSPCFSLFFF